MEGRSPPPFADHPFSDKVNLNGWDKLKIKGLCKFGGVVLTLFIGWNLSHYYARHNTPGILGDTHIIDDPKLLKRRMDVALSYAESNKFGLKLQTKDHFVPEDDSVKKTIPSRDDIDTTMVLMFKD